MKHQIGTERKIKSSDTEREALYFELFCFLESFALLNHYLTVLAVNASTCTE